MFKWDQVSTNQTIPAPRTGLFGCVCVSGKFVLICPLLSLEREVFHLLWVEQWWSLQEGVLQEACKSSYLPLLRMKNTTNAFQCVHAGGQ